MMPRSLGLLVYPRSLVVRPPGSPLMRAGHYSTLISSRSSFLISCIEREHVQLGSLAHEEVKA